MRLLFCSADSRKAASAEISRTQQDLVAQHKVKPAASSGVKESLVSGSGACTGRAQRPCPWVHGMGRGAACLHQRWLLTACPHPALSMHVCCELPSAACLTPACPCWQVHRLSRALQRPGQPARSRFLPAPPAAPLAPPAGPEVEVASPLRAARPYLLDPPKTLAVRNGPSAELEQRGIEGHTLEEARVATAVVTGGAGQGGQGEGLPGDTDQEARVGATTCAEESIPRSERSLDGNGGPEARPVGGAGVREGLPPGSPAGLEEVPGNSSQKGETSSPPDSCADSDSDVESTPARCEPALS